MRSPKGHPGDKVKSVAYWRGRLDEVGETAARAELEQIDPVYRRANVEDALEAAVRDFRARESIAQPEREEERAEEGARHARQTAEATQRTAAATERMAEATGQMVTSNRRVMWGVWATAVIAATALVWEMWQASGADRVSELPRGPEASSEADEPPAALPTPSD